MQLNSQGSSVSIGFPRQINNQQSYQSAVIFTTHCVTRPLNLSNPRYNGNIQLIHSDTIDLQGGPLWLDWPASSVLPREGLSLEDLELFSLLWPRVAACTLGSPWVSSGSTFPWDSSGSGRPWPLDEVAHRLASWGYMWRTLITVITFSWFVWYCDYNVP